MKKQDVLALLADLPDEFDADLIAMATSFRMGLGPVFVGGVAEQVARRASVAVAIVRCPA